MIYFNISYKRKMEEEKELDLGTAKIGKLLRIFAIPSVISLLVNALYNIVDQIFIGQGVRNFSKWRNEYCFSNNNDLFGVCTYVW